MEKAKSFSMHGRMYPLQNDPLASTKVKSIVKLAHNALNKGTIDTADGKCNDMTAFFPKCNLVYETMLKIEEDYENATMWDHVGHKTLKYRPNKHIAEVICQKINIIKIQLQIMRSKAENRAFKISDPKGKKPKPK